MLGANNIRHDPGTGSGPGGWSQEEIRGAVGSAVQDEAGEDDRGQTVNLNCILQAMGSLWRILITRAELFKKISLVICRIDQRGKRDGSVK